MPSYNPFAHAYSFEKIGESIVIDGHIRVQVVRVEGDVVKLGIEAP